MILQTHLKFYTPMIELFERENCVVALSNYYEQTVMGNGLPYS